ncbi:MAG: glycosyltransferase [Brooklawnia sp.]|jgi:glycosyltransferase involved in cell wall biosynthesis
MDSVVDGVTGRVVPVEDAQALADALAGLISDPASRERFGRQARERAVRDFDQNDVWARHHDHLLSGHQA